LQRSETSDDDERRSAARRWTVRDAIDFEALLRRDADDPSIAHADDATPRVDVGADRRTVFLAWIDRQRARSAKPLPGTVYDRARRLVRVLAALAGLSLGAGLVGGLLSRGDAEPVNALLFFAGTVGIQLVFLAAAALAWLLGRTNLRVQPLRDALLILVRAVARLVDRLDGERRSALRARWAALDLRAGPLAPLVACQMLVVTQLFAIAFNLGLLAALLLVYLPLVELRFGWQSTYSIGPDGIGAWVRVVAAPWSWVDAALAPDAAQVAATQFTRGQSATTLPATAARAWWPFLVCAIAFYGLAVRATLAVAAALVLRARLARLAWTQPAAHALWRSLTGPLVAAEPNAAALPDVASPGPRRHGSGTCLLVVDHELVCANGDIGARIEGIVGARVAASFAANIDDDVLRDDLVTALRDHGGRVVVATSGRRDPVRAVADCLRALSAAARPGADLTVLLVGDGACDERVTIWSRFLAIHRVGFGVERAP